jgi:diguanylate cyclase (GGDEF)-like protein/PAS domain S-box-containing protein
MSNSGSPRGLIPVASSRLRARDSASTDPTVMRLVAGLSKCETCFDVSIGSLIEPFALLRPVREEGEIVDFVYEYANDPAKAASANAPEELVGTRMLAQLAPVALFDAYVTVMETGNPLELFDFAPLSRVRGDHEQPRFDVRALKAGELLVLRWQDVTERDRHEADHNVLDTIVRSSDDAIMSLDADMRITAWNRGAEDVYGYSSQEILGKSSDVLIPTDATAESRGLREQAAAGGRVQRYETQRRHADGTLIEVAITAFAQTDASGLPAGLTTITRDITKQVRATRALTESDERYHEILDASPDGVWRIDVDGRTDYVNQRMASMIGYSPEEIIGRQITDFMSPADTEIAQTAITNNREQDRVGVVEHALERKDGTSCWVRVSQRALTDAYGKPSGGLAILSDITASKAQAVELSETVNFLALVTESMAEAVCAINVDGQFTYMNETAATVLGWTKEDLVGRTAHETIHHQHEDGSPYPATECPLLDLLNTGRTLHAEEDTFTCRDGRLLPVSYSAAPIINDSGIHGLVMVFSDFTKRRDEQARLRKELEGAAWVGQIQDALDEDRFVLYQQPIIDVRTREIVRTELLIRMISRDGEIIAPGRFLPTAEQYGQIAQIDLWVMSQACKLAANGQKVNFNISGQSLGSRDLITALAAELKNTGADPALLVCEITETALAADEALAEAFLKELVDLGCEVALDDFGMGYGGFSYLKRFSFNELKIDLEFGRDLIDNPQNQHVVKAIVSLAKGFGRTTVAEGIEDVATLDLLQQYGVDYAQGYAIGKPAPIEIARGKPKPATAVQPTATKRRRRHGDAMCSRLAQAYGETMRTGDPAAATAVIDDALRHKLSAPEIQSRLIAPAMRQIGELWERGGLTVAQEHLACAVSYHVLTRLYPGLLRHSTRQGDTVVVAAVHGEHHVLGLRMVADVFDGAGFDVRFLGADVPESSLLTWVQEHEPAVVALGVTMPLGAATLARQLQTLRDLAPSIQLVIGGQGVPNVLREGAGVLYAADTEQLTACLDSSLNTPAPGELPRGIAAGGVGFGRYAELPNNATGGLEARMAQTTAAAADAARGQARRAFVLEQLALRDPLTELWNRRAFDDRYQELTVAGVLHSPTIVMIDVDQFKSINDGFGHDAGDRALIGVARGILSALRPGDFAARYGGDEFVVLLPDTPHDEAARIAERIRIKIESSMTDPPLTVSIGVSVPAHTDRRRASLDVDQALYTAKEHGRNQVVFA